VCALCLEQVDDADVLRVLPVTWVDLLLPLRFLDLDDDDLLLLVSAPRALAARCVRAVVRRDRLILMCAFVLVLVLVM